MSDKVFQLAQAIVGGHILGARNFSEFEYQLAEEVCLLRAGLEAEINRNTPLEARMRKALEEIRSFVAVPFDSFDPDMAADLNAGSVVRMALIARNALLVESSHRMHDALGTTSHSSGGSESDDRP